MIRPHRIPVLDALDVVPHAVPVDEARTRRLRRDLHRAVDVRGDARDHGRRAACRDARATIRGRGRGCRRCRRRRRSSRSPRSRTIRPPRAMRPRRARRRTARGCRRVAPVTVPSAEVRAVTRCRARIVTRPCASPASTAAWNGATIPGPVPHVMWKRGTELPGPSAVYPPRSAQPTTGKNPTPFSRSHGPLLVVGELQVRLRPPPRPGILVAVESGRAEPVLTGEVERVVDAHPPLLGRVDEEQPAERPPRLAAEVRAGLLVDDHDPLARRDRFAGRDEAGQAPADDEDVGGKGGGGGGHVDSFVGSGKRGLRRVIRRCRRARAVRR